MTYRISKYNPKNRIDGIYTLDEWTDYSDIGMIFDGKVFTEQEYLEMENRYINCILDICKICAIDAVKITDLEIYDSVLWNGNDYVTYDNMNKIICDCLRNKCWCKLEQKDFFIHFGYDYYVYLNCSIDKDIVEKICRGYQLFCELIEQSPYEI